MDENGITFNDEDANDLTVVDNGITFADDDIVDVPQQINNEPVFKKVSSVDTEPTLVIDVPNVALKPFGRNRMVQNQPVIKKQSVRKQVNNTVANEVNHASVEGLGDLPGNIMYNLTENLENSLHEKKEKLKVGVKGVASGVANGVLAAKFPASQMQMASLSNGNSVYIVPGTIVMDTSGNMVMMNTDCNFVQAGQSDLAMAAFNAGANMARNALLQRMTPSEAVNRFGFTQDEVNMAINGSSRIADGMTPRQVDGDNMVRSSLDKPNDSQHTSAMDARRRRAAAIMKNVEENQRINAGPGFDIGGRSL